MAIKSVIGKNKDFVRGSELNDDVLIRIFLFFQRFVRLRFEFNFKLLEVCDFKFVF